MATDFRRDQNANGCGLRLFIFEPLQLSVKGVQKMIKSPVQKPILNIDLKIRFQSRIYQVSLSRIVRWVAPLMIVVARLISHILDKVH